MSLISPAATNGKATAKSKRRGKKPSGDQTKIVDAEQESDLPTIPTSPADVSDVVQSEQTKPEKEHLKELSKRLRKSTKKLEGIERSEEKIKDLTEEEKLTTTLINKDERKKIADKPITQAVHKELQEVYDKLKEQIDTEERITEQKREEQKRQFEDKLETSIKMAKDDGYQLGLVEGKQSSVQEGKDKVSTLVKFLRLAGYRRSVKSDNPQDDEAIEQVLVLVYSGDENALNTCWKLSDASPEMISGSCNVSFARIKKLAHTLVINDEEEPTSQITSSLLEAPSIGSDNTMVGVEGQENSVDSVQHAENEATTDMPDNFQDLNPFPGDVTEVQTKSVSERDKSSRAPKINGGKNHGTITEPKSSDVINSDFQNVESRRGKGGRMGYRGRGDGNFRGRSRGGFRGDRTDHRGRGTFRGRRGDGNRTDNSHDIKLDHQPAQEKVVSSV